MAGSSPSRRTRYTFGRPFSAGRRFFDAFVVGALVSPATLDLMLEPNAAVPGTDDLERYGYGMELTVVDGRVTIFGHAGGDPGISTMTSHFVDAATSLIVLCNQDAGSWAVSQQVAFGLSDPRGWQNARACDPQGSITTIRGEGERVGADGALSEALVPARDLMICSGHEPSWGPFSRGRSVILGVMTITIRPATPADHVVAPSEGLEPQPYDP